MKKLLILTFGILISSSVAFAQYRVYANTGVSRQTSMGMLDNRNFPFVAQFADGFNIQPAGWNLLSETERTTIANQFTNKNVLLETVYTDGQNPNTTAAVQKLPAGASITTQMIYSEAPDISIEDIQAIKAFNPTMPISTNNRSFTNNQTNKDRLALVDGMYFEFNPIYDTNKFNDVVFAIKYAIDRGKTICLLNPNSSRQSGDSYVSDYKKMFYYLKKSLSQDYFYSDKLIFSPANYNGKSFMLTPETEGSGTLGEVVKWLIEQKTTVRTYLQPDVSFNVNSGDLLENNSNLTVNTTVDYAGIIANVKLYLDGQLVSQDNSAPYTFSGGILSGLKYGLHELKAIATDNSGKTGDRIVVFNVKNLPLTIPGTIKAVDVSTVSSTVEIFGDDYIHNVRSTNVITYKINVTQAGLYDIKFGVNISAAKQTGGTIILKKGSTELGRFSTEFNIPNPISSRNPLLVSNGSPNDVIIPNINLVAGIQDLTLTFANPPSPFVAGVMFGIVNIDFKLQGAPVLSFTTPKVNENINQYFGPNAIETGADATFEAGTNQTIAVNATSASGIISKVDLYKDNVLVRSLTSAPYSWNNVGQDPLLSNLTEGPFNLKALATDNLGKIAAKSISVKVIKQTPYKAFYQIPGVIEAEDYDLGGQGISFNDLSNTLTGVKYRLTTFQDFVGINQFATGKYNVSWSLPGEWLEYTVNAKSDGTYAISFYTSCTTTGKTFSVLLDGVNVGSGAVKITAAGAYNFVTVTGIAIKAGDHVIRFINNTGGFDFDRMVFTNEKVNQLITFLPMTDSSVGALPSDFEPASINSSLAISYFSSNQNVATIVSGKVHLTGIAGSTLITAKQDGNATYNPAEPVLRSLTVKPMLSISSINLNNNEKLVVYPNPTSGIINFKLNSILNIVVSVTLTDLSGKIVHQENVQPSALSHYSLNLTKRLTSGLYILTCSTDQNFKQSASVIVK